MKIIYRADDGTEFYNEDDCTEYEEKQRISGMKLASRFWDRNGHPLLIEDLAGTVTYAYYAELATDEEAVFINDYAYKKNDYCFFDEEDEPKAGRYYYDSYRDLWMNIEELNKSYREVLTIFEGE